MRALTRGMPRGLGHDRGKRGRKNCGRLKLAWDSWHQQWANHAFGTTDWTEKASDRPNWLNLAQSFVTWAHKRFRLGGQTADGVLDLELLTHSLRKLREGMAS